MNLTLTDRAVVTARQMQKLGFPVTAMGGDAETFNIKFDMPSSKDFSLWLQVLDAELVATLIHIPTSDWVFRMAFPPKNLKLVIDCFVVPASKAYANLEVA